MVIEGPIGANLGTMQAGGTINITAREECKFTVDGTNDWLVLISATMASVDLLLLIIRCSCYLQSAPRSRTTMVTQSY